MSTKRVLAFVLTLATVLPVSFVAPPAASAGVFVGIQVGAPPPPLRHEVVIVRPGPGYVWVPGYWDWVPARHDYIWIGGRWVRPHHRHAVWVAPRWERRHGAVFFIRGHWRY